MYTIASSKSILLHDVLFRQQCICTKREWSESLVVRNRCVKVNRSCDGIAWALSYSFSEFPCSHVQRVSKVEVVTRKKF